MDGVEQSERKIQGGDRSDSDGCHATGGADRTCGGWQDNDVCWRHAVYHAIAQGPGDWNDGGIRRWSGYCIRLDGAQPWLLSGGRYAAGDHAFQSGVPDPSADYGGGTQSGSGAGDSQDATVAWAGEQSADWVSGKHAYKWSIKLFGGRRVVHGIV